jgi:hypothetical protein
MAATGRTFRVFLSSTFGDLQEERNALQRNVFPSLRRLCSQHGCRFQAIDLRWGVREEAARDQQTMRICLGEIERCQHISPRPNFVVLLGDRYGWRPLPYEIPADEYDAIKRSTESAEDRALLGRWYERDDNAVPAVRVLKPRVLEVRADASQEEQRQARDQDAAAWRRTETRLKAILSTAVAKLSIPGESRMKYQGSATEQEIVAGAMKVEDAEEHVLCFVRRIDGLPRDSRAGPFTDLNDDGRIDDEAQGRLADLKSRLRKRIPGNFFDHYVATWEGERPTNAHLDRLCRDVHEKLSAVIRGEIRKLEEVDAVEKEAADHGLFALERTKVFCGRETSLRAIDAYLDDPDQRPFVVLGASGSGKSALMAMALERARRRSLRPVVVARFIGATPESTDGRALLESVCREISRRYADESAIPSDFPELVEQLPKRLALATAERPLLLTVDALDQLSESHNARCLAWLPSEIPANTALVVSAAPGECWTALERRTPSDHVEVLAPMAREDGAEILDLWLKGAGRALQPAQRRALLETFEVNGLPLYLKLAFEEARLWRSAATPPPLSADIPGIVRDLFSRLASETNHGRALVADGLAFLRAAKHGLSEDEILDVLSADERVFVDFSRRSFHRPPEPRLPVVVWSRLYSDLAPYLVERSADGTTLLDFFHRQMGEVVDTEFLAGGERRRIHERLADYFAGQPLFAEEDGRKTPNLRRLSELPYQQTHAEQWESLHATLTDFEFLEAKCAYSGVISSGRGEGAPAVDGGVYELIEDYRRALAAFPEEGPDVGSGRSDH